MSCGSSFALDGWMTRAGLMSPAHYGTVTPIGSDLQITEGQAGQSSRSRARSALTIRALRAYRKKRLFGLQLSAEADGPL